jgi:hypothetical protein
MGDGAASTLGARSTHDPQSRSNGGEQRPAVRHEAVALRRSQDRRRRLDTARVRLQRGLARSECRRDPVTAIVQHMKAGLHQ